MEIIAEMFEQLGKYVLSLRHSHINSFSLTRCAYFLEKGWIFRLSYSYSLFYLILRAHFHL